MALKLLLLVTFLSLSYAQQQTTFPPDYWCTNNETATKFGVVKQCNDYAQAVYNQKVNFTLLYESYCPDCHHWINDVLSQLWPQYKDFVNLELVPFGNAELQPSGEISCQHGDDECKLNRVHGCAIYYLKKMDPIVSYVICLSKKAGSADPESVMKACFQEQSISSTLQDKISACWNGPLGKKIEAANAKRTNSAWPVQKQWVPWFLVNDVSTYNIQRTGNVYLEGFQALLCIAYRGDNPPGDCASEPEQARRSSQAAVEQPIPDQFFDPPHFGRKRRV